MQIYLPFIASALYLAVLFVPTRLRTLGAMLSALAWLVHGVTLWGSVFASDSLRVGFAVMLSSALWVTVSVYLVENRNFSLEGLKFLLLPPVALATPVFVLTVMVVPSGLMPPSVLVVAIGSE